MRVALKWTICVVALLLTVDCAAQQKAGLAPYVKVDAATVVLNHVRVIDGTGRAATEDMRIVIAGGKITAIGPEFCAGCQGP